MKILLIEDDETLLQKLADQLNSASFSVDCCTDGDEGLYRSREFVYDLAIIDLGLPKRSGIDVIQTLRHENYSHPIIVLTARSSWQDKVHGLRAGADDYLVKPFQFEELLARVHALLRRAGGYAKSDLTQGPIKLNIETQELSVNGTAVAVTAFEYKLIHYFMLHPGRVVTKSVIADYLYNEDVDRDSNVIEVLVARLRQKIDPDGSLKPIETLRGRGYRFGIKPSP